MPVALALAIAALAVTCCEPRTRCVAGCMSLTCLTTRGFHPFRCIAAAAGVVITGLFVLFGVAILRDGGVVADFGWTEDVTSGRAIVRTVDSAGPAAGCLRPGDEIIGDSDVPLHLLGRRFYWREMPRSERYTIRVRRYGIDLTLTLKAATSRSRRLVWFVARMYVVSLVWFVVAIVVGTIKPRQPSAQLACVAGVATSLALLEYGLNSQIEFLHGLSLAAYLLLRLASPVHLFLGYSFYSRFPCGLPHGRVWRFLGIVFGCSTILLVVFQKLVPLLVDSSGERVALAFYATRSLVWAFIAVNTLSLLVFPATILAQAAVVTCNYRFVTDVDQRRRLKWLTYGSVIGLAPLGVMEATQLLLVVTGHRQIAEGVRFNAIYEETVVALVIIPLSFGYAIIKHRVFDISFVVRRGVQYLFAKNLLRFLLSLPIMGLAYGVVANRHLTLGELLFRHVGYLFQISMLLASLWSRKDVLRWLDRRFFREAYDRERLLVELLDALDRIDSTTEISSLVSAKLELALHPKRVFIWYREEQPYEVAFAEDRRAGPPAEGGMVEHLERRPTILKLSAPQVYEVPHAGHEQLRELGISLVVPIPRADQKVVGIMALGEKMSEEPYSETDRRLLQAVAKQIAVVRENLALKDRVEHERRVQREMLARFQPEFLNIARECPHCGSCFDDADRVCPFDGCELVINMPVERLVDGKYRLDRLIGKGGMGAVYQAWDLRLDRDVALKVILSSASNGQPTLRRFDREARAAAKLNHPNIVTVYDCGSVPGVAAYLVMERLRGLTLRARLSAVGPVRPDVAAAWFDQILDGVDAAHRAGVIHRDLKPENIFLTRPDDDPPTVKVLDFGLAKVRWLELAEPTTRTMPGLVFGTPGYISPEQLAGGEADERSDIFALGVILAETLTGLRQRLGTGTPMFFESMLPNVLQTLGSGAEIQQLARVLLGMLARNPAERFASIVTLRAELIPALLACSPSPDREARVRANTIARRAQLASIGTF